MGFLGPPSEKCYNSPQMSSTKSVALFYSDLDSTLLGRPDATTSFRRTWEALGNERPRLVYRTGRLIRDAMNKIRKGRLPEPDSYTDGVMQEFQHDGVLDETLTASS